MILRRIIKIAATRCHNLKVKCTEFDFGCGSAPAPAVGAYRPLSGFKGPLLLKGGDGRGGQVRAGERDGREKRSEGVAEGEGEEDWASPTHYFRLKSRTASIWPVGTGLVRTNVSACAAGIWGSWPPEIFSVYLKYNILHSDAFFGSENGH